MLLKATVLGAAFYVFYYLGWYLKYQVQVDTSPGGAVDWRRAQQEVVQVFRDSWRHYEHDAWGQDVYKPLSQRGENMGPKPLGWMIVDSLDTMMLMGLEDELKVSRAWIKNELSYDFDYDVNVFETTIRMIGGFLSAYYLSGDELYLDKAVDLGDRIVGGFDSPSGIPYASVNLKTRRGKQSHADGGASSTAEVATLQLEFKYLAKLTGEALYWEKAENVIKRLDDNNVQDGLVPIFVRPDSGRYQGNYIRLGSRGDTYYEYLIKQYLQTNKTEDIYKTMYDESLSGIKKHLLGHSEPNKLTFIGELENGVGGPLSSKMDHLVCFVGGMLALGATEGKSIDEARRSARWSPKLEQDFTLAKEMTHTCWKMYEDVEPSGLSPEIVVFNTDKSSTSDFYIKPMDKHNLQRPETIESLFVLYRITKDPIYREWGYKMFKSFEKYTKTPNGAYTSLKDVTSTPPKQMDNMESFWLSETLKYFYLLFEDDDSVLPLDQVVFSTEAHPMPVFDKGRFKTGWSRAHHEKSNAQEAHPKAQQAQAQEAHPKAQENAGAHQDKPKVLENAPAAEKPAKPAIEQLKEIKDELESEVKQQAQHDSDIAKKLKSGENVNKILDELIE